MTPNSAPSGALPCLLRDSNIRLIYFYYLLFLRAPRAPLSAGSAMPSMFNPFPASLLSGRLLYQLECDLYLSRVFYRGDSHNCESYFVLSLTASTSQASLFPFRSSHAVLAAQELHLRGCCIKLLRYVHFTFFLGHHEAPCLQAGSTDRLRRPAPNPLYMLMHLPAI